MKPFVFEQAATTAEAARAVAQQTNAMFLAGGTTLVDLMKIDVLTPETVVHVGQLALNDIEVEDLIRRRDALQAIRDQTGNHRTRAKPRAAWAAQSEL